LSTATAPAAPGGTAYGTPGYRMYVLLSLTFVYTLNFIDRNLVNVIAQPIINEFGLSDTQYGFLNGPPFAIFYAFLGIPIAMMADRFNRIRIIAISIAIWSLMAALCGFAASFLFLLMARIGVAIGEAGSTPPSNSVIGDYFTPRKRAAALGIFAMGVTLGGALSNFFGGPIAHNLNGKWVESVLTDWGWTWALNMADWSSVDGWRVAFVVIGAPGLLVATILWFTVKEPPRGYSDPPGTIKQKSLNILETLKELGAKPTFWTMTAGASLVALVGYGLIGFQAPMAQRLHGIDHSAYALHFGGPLAIVAALGTLSGGMIIERISGRFNTAVAVVPAIGMVLAVPLYIYAFYAPTENLFGSTRVIWCLGAFCHYMYLGSQYTISQGVVGQHSRASAVAIMLLLIALVGNGLGPQIVGWLSDMFMTMELKEAGYGGVLTGDLCRNVKVAATLAIEQQGVCKAAYGEGLRSSMIVTALIFLPAALCFWLSSLTLKKDMVAQVH
jgi:MFS family permease